MNAFDFLRPSWVPGLLLVPAVFLFLASRNRARLRRLRPSVGPRLPELAGEVDPRRRRLRPLLFSLAVLFALVATIEPRYGHAQSEASWQGVDVVLCLDVSRSMRATDLEPDRLGRAKQAIHQLVARTTGDRLALVCFAGDARLVSPLTSDLRSFVHLADEAGPSTVPLGGTDLGAALQAALEALGDAGRPAAIVLLTDGEDFGARGLRMARRCRARGVPVHCVGLGSALGSKIPLTTEGRKGFLRDRSGNEVISALKPDTLRALCDAGGGAFVAAGAADEPLADLYDDEILPTARLSATQVPSPRKESRYQWPLLLALLLWLGELAVGDRRRA